VQQVMNEFLPAGIAAHALLDQAAGGRRGEAGVVHLVRRHPLAVGRQSDAFRAMALYAVVAAAMRGKSPAIHRPCVELVAGQAALVMELGVETVAEGHRRRNDRACASKHQQEHQQDAHAQPASERSVGTARP
jgi:hypothetical protein